MKSTRSTAAIVTGIGLVGIGFVGAGTVLAQAPPTDPLGTKAPVSAGPQEPNDEQPSTQAPVLRVTSVEVIRSTHGSPLDIIRVRGLASTSGWEEAELVPLTRGTPKDGMLELVFVARAPSEAKEATGFEVVEAILPIDPSHPFKGVNVHSATQSVTLTQFPGYAESKGGVEDCSKCVGKVFVPKGSPLPSGRSAAEVVKEEQLPPLSRVIKHSDGIPASDSNPNRLTLVLGLDGTISSALWD